MDMDIMKLERSSELFAFRFLLLHFNDFSLLYLLLCKFLLILLYTTYVPVAVLPFDAVGMCVCFNFVSLSFHTLWQVFKSALSCALHTHTRTRSAHTRNEASRERTVPIAQPYSMYCKTRILGQCATKKNVLNLLLKKSADFNSIQIEIIGIFLLKLNYSK